MSEGPTANFGGVHDWTFEGSMTSDVLNEALLNLPVGQLSGIIEDSRGFHIIRVTERVLAGRTPFPDVQAQIKQKLKQERTERLIHQYVEKLQSSTKIWTIFDGPTDSQVIPGAGFYTSPVEAGLPATVPQRPNDMARPPTPPLGPRYQ